MSACDTCSQPGHCCKDFHLIGARGTPKFKTDTWERDAQTFADQNALPFKPFRIEPDPKHEVQEGRVTVRFMCPRLTPEGRCGDYENRPTLCRSYEALSDGLCVMYVAPTAEAAPQ